MFRLAAIFALIANTAAADPNFWKFEWPNTDFEIMNVQSWVEILSGGSPKHGIPAIDGPSFVDVFDESRITDREPVITLELAGETPRAYPIRYLMWHELVNDDIWVLPVVVTFCPLCNSGITFDRRVGGQVLSFGVSG